MNGFAFDTDPSGPILTTGAEFSGNQIIALSGHGPGLTVWGPVTTPFSPLTTEKDQNVDPGQSAVFIHISWSGTGSCRSIVFGANAADSIGGATILLAMIQVAITLAGDLSTIQLSRILTTITGTVTQYDSVIDCCSPSVPETGTFLAGLASAGLVSDSLCRQVQVGQLPIISFIQTPQSGKAVSLDCIMSLTVWRKS